MANSLSESGTKRIRIAFVEMGSGHGGSAYSLLRILQVLATDHSDTAAFTVFGSSEAALGLFAEAGHNTEVLRTASAWRHFLTCWRFAERFDVLHCNNAPYDHLPGILAALGRSLPVTVHFRCSRGLTRRERWVLPKVAYCFSVSAAGDRMLAPVVPADRRVMLGDGVRLDEYEVDSVAARQILGIDPSAFAVLLPATLQPGKGQEAVIQAARLCGQGRRPLAWLLAGGEHYQHVGYRALLHARAQEAGVQDEVRFLGHRDDMPQVLAAADVVVLPSTLTEGLPCVIMEAMAAGRPVVASAVGGIPEVVDADVGALVTAGDDAALADAIMGLRDDPARYADAADAARRRAVERFDVRTITGTMLDVYRGLVRKAHA